jgi:hypothetical protein
MLTHQIWRINDWMLIPKKYSHIQIQEQTAVAIGNLSMHKDDKVALLRMHFLCT